MTDNEIIKALSICSNENGICSECPYSDDYTNCNTRIAKDALDLINRQQSEIERLNKVYQANQQLINALNKSYFLAKSEAYKEFAKLLRRQSFDRLYVSVDEINNLLKEIVGDDNAEEKE